MRVSKLVMIFFVVAIFVGGAIAAFADSPSPASTMAPSVSSGASSDWNYEFNEPQWLVIQHARHVATHGD